MRLFTGAALLLVAAGFVTGCRKEPVAEPLPPAEGQARALNIRKRAVTRDESVTTGESRLPGSALAATTTAF